MAHVANELTAYRKYRDIIIFEYRKNISSDIINGQRINNNSLSEIEEKWKLFEVSQANLIAYLGDFIDELQNKYQSKLFKKYKIPRRKPKSDSKVLSLKE